MRRAAPAAILRPGALQEVERFIRINQPLPQCRAMAADGEIWLYMTSTA
jgi:hypothetical protein